MHNTLFFPHIRRGLITVPNPRKWLYHASLAAKFSAAPHSHCICCVFALCVGAVNSLNFADEHILFVKMLGSCSYVIDEEVGKY
jgi:hypothetical protein